MIAATDQLVRKDRFVVEIRIRLATSADDGRLTAIEQEWPPELQVAPPSGDGTPFFARRRTEDILVADDGGEVVGYVHLAPHSSMPVNAHVLHVNALLVARNRRGVGVGGLLLDAAIREARVRGKRKLGLRVLGSNSHAIRLYERAGFSLEGRLRDEFLLADDRFEDDLWYGMDLTAA